MYESIIIDRSRVNISLYSRLINGEKFAIFEDLLKKQGRQGLFVLNLTGKSYHTNCKIFTPGSVQSLD